MMKMWAQIGQLFRIFLEKALITCPLSTSELKAYIYHMGYPLVSKYVLLLQILLQVTKTRCVFLSLTYMIYVQNTVL